jgi:hypothetical protein
MATKEQEGVALAAQHLLKFLRAKQTCQALRDGIKAHSTDAANRNKLSKWVDQQVEKASEEKLRKNGGEAAFRAQLENKAAKKLAEAQRARYLKVPGGTVGVRKWLPAGVDVSLQSENSIGRSLVATRDFMQGEIVMYEKVALVAKCDAEYTYDASPQDQRKQLRAQLDAFNSADRITQQRVLGMHQQKPPSQLESVFDGFVQVSVGAMRRDEIT